MAGHLAASAANRPMSHGSPCSSNRTAPAIAPMVGVSLIVSPPTSQTTVLASVFNSRITLRSTAAASPYKWSYKGDGAKTAPPAIPTIAFST